MSELTGIFSTPNPASGVEASRGPSPRAAIKQLLATLLSAVWPGAGHLALGQLPKGMLLSALFIGILCGFWPLRLLRYYPGFVVLFVGWLVLGLYCACSTQLLTSPKTGYRVSKWWLTFTVPATLLIVSLTGAGVTRLSGFRDFSVPSTSMEPTIQRGDRIVVDTHVFAGFSPQYRDVIVCYKGGSFLIKRVIGVGGDVVEGKNGNIILNGNLLNESYIQHSIAGSPIGWPDTGNGWMRTFGPVTVPPGKYFVLGDNRDESLDSRSGEFGFVDRNAIIGRVLYVYNTAREGTRVR